MRSVSLRGIFTWALESSRFWQALCVKLEAHLSVSNGDGNACVQQLEYCKQERECLTGAARENCPVWKRDKREEEPMLVPPDIQNGLRAVGS